MPHFWGAFVLPAPAPAWGGPAAQTPPVASLFETLGLLRHSPARAWRVRTGPCGNRSAYSHSPRTGGAGFRVNGVSSCGGWAHPWAGLGWGTQEPFLGCFVGRGAAAQWTPWDGPDPASPGWPCSWVGQGCCQPQGQEAPTLGAEVGVGFPSVSPGCILILQGRGVTIASGPSGRPGGLWERRSRERGFEQGGGFTWSLGRPRRADVTECLLAPCHSTREKRSLPECLTLPGKIGNDPSLT